jgi:hypothetical protein
MEQSTHGGVSSKGEYVVEGSHEANQPYPRGEVKCLAAPKEGLVGMVSQGQGWGRGRSGSHVRI